MTSKMNTRRSSRPRRAKTEAVAIYDIGEAISDAVQVFDADDTVCFLGDAYCPLTDLISWMETLPATQRTQRRYAIGIGRVTERETGKIMAPYVKIDRIPRHAHVCPHGIAQIKRAEMTPILFLQSLSFLQNEIGWQKMQRVRLVALDGDGLQFEDA